MKADLKQWFFVLLAIVVMLVGGAVVIINGLTWYWAVAVFLIAFTCLTFVANKQTNQRMEAYFSGRPVLNENEFGEHYFPLDRAEVAAQLRKILANHVGIDLSRMDSSRIIVGRG